MVASELLPLLSALKFLTDKLATIETKVDNVQSKLEDLEEEWRVEFELESSSDSESESESESETESEPESVQSAPATFSLKRQRRE